MQLTMGRAERASHFLARLHDDQDHDGHTGFGAICGLCTQALDGVLNKEDDQLVDFVKSLRKGYSMAEGAK